MNFVDEIIVNTIHILLPIMLYIFYITYRKVDDERESDLALFILIFSLVYVALKYNNSLVSDFPLLTINVALFIAYFKRKNLAIIITSLVIICYLCKFYNEFWFIVFLEYIIFYLIYLFLNKKFNINYFITICLLFKFMFMAIMLFLTSKLTIDDCGLLLLLCFSFALYMYIIIYFMRFVEKILKMHKSLKETVSENDFRNSLFKITHEIKNPIAVCKGYLDMFDVNNQEHSKRYIPIVKEEIDKTLLLLEDFLSMNRLKLNKDILDINLLVDEVLSNYEFYLKEKKIKLVKNILDDEVYINGDYNRLTQVLVNIIKNSVEAMEEGQIEVKSRVIKNKIYIDIKDNGSGMSKEVLSKIREPFFTTKKNGNGLGVALAYEIIEAHNGQMKYDSKESEYTSVEIAFPVVKL